MKHWVLKGWRHNLSVALCVRQTLWVHLPLEIISAHLDHFDECLSGLFVLSWDFSATQQWTLLEIFQSWQFSPSSSSPSPSLSLKPSSSSPSSSPKWAELWNAWGVEVCWRAHLAPSASGYISQSQQLMLMIFCHLTILLVSPLTPRVSYVVSKQLWSSTTPSPWPGDR